MSPLSPESASLPNNLEVLKKQLALSTKSEYKNITPFVVGVLAALSITLAACAMGFDVFSRQFSFCTLPKCTLVIGLGLLGLLEFSLLGLINFFGVYYLVERRCNNPIKQLEEKLSNASTVQELYSRVQNYPQVLNNAAKLMNISELDVMRNQLGSKKFQDIVTLKDQEMSTDSFKAWYEIFTSRSIAKIAYATLTEGSTSEESKVLHIHFKGAPILEIPLDGNQNSYLDEFLSDEAFGAIKSGKLESFDFKNKPYMKEGLSKIAKMSISDLRILLILTKKAGEISERKKIKEHYRTIAKPFLQQ